MGSKTIIRREHGVSYEDVERLFQRAAVSERYAAIRNSEAVKQHYDSSVVGLRAKNEGNPIAQRLLEDNMVAETVEDVIKGEIVCGALEQMIKSPDNPTLEEVIVSIINETNLKEMITKATEVKKGEIESFSRAVARGMCLLDAILSWDLDLDSED